MDVARKGKVGGRNRQLHSLTSLSLGGTPVTISGSDLEGASAAKFGSMLTASFTINSESQITAITPAAALRPVIVSVRTPAGTANSS